MAITDSTADKLTVLRNGSRAKKEVVEVAYSTFFETILKMLKREKFISNFKVMAGENNKSTIRVYLKYHKDGAPAILGIKRVSKPGLKIYKGADAVPKVYAGLGIAIISTSKGLLTDEEARSQNIGGEVVCYVW